MRNILSFKTGTPFLGKEIKDWISYHMENQTSHTVIAKRMERFLNISDNVYYWIDLSPIGTGCGERKYHHPVIVRIK